MNAAAGYNLSIAILFGFAFTLFAFLDQHTQIIALSLAIYTLLLFVAIFLYSFLGMIDRQYVLSLLVDLHTTIGE
jgi:uncharacterized membrane protein YadS